MDMKNVSYLTYHLHEYLRITLEIYDWHELMNFIDELTSDQLKQDLNDDELLKKYLLSFISDLQEDLKCEDNYKDQIAET